MKEWIAMFVLAGLLLAVAAYYLRTSIRVLRRTTPAFEMMPDERRFLRRQAWRRVINSLLMIALAGMLVGIYASGVVQRAKDLGDAREQAAVDGEKPKLTDDERQFGRIFGGLIIALLLLLGAIVAVAGVDAWATRSYALTALRKIQTDRRAMIERQMARWREENGQE